MYHQVSTYRFLTFIMALATLPWYSCTTGEVKYPQPGQPYVLVNNTNEPLQLTPEQAGLDFVELDEVLDTIRKNAAAKNISISISAWEYVLANTAHFLPLSTQPLACTPHYMLNSTRFGWCSNRAALLAHILVAMGQPSRIIYLEGHVVMETFAEGRWQVFDADQGVYFTDSIGNVMSYGELSQTTLAGAKIHYYSAQKTPLIVMHYNNSDTLVSGGLVHRLYSSTHNNSIDSSIASYSQTVGFQLPPFSSLFYWEGDSSSSSFQKTVLAVKVSKRSMGALQIPLLPIAISGNMKVEWEEGTIENHTAQPQLFANLEHYNGTLQVVGVEDSGFIYYLANGVTLEKQLNPSLGNAPLTELYSPQNNSYFFDLSRKVLVEPLTSDEITELEGILAFIKSRPQIKEYWKRASFTALCDEYADSKHLSADGKTRLNNECTLLHNKITEAIHDSANVVWEPENLAMLLFFCGDRDY